MDIEDRGHGRGACYLILFRHSHRTSTDRQARYTPGSVEGIRGALAWAGLDYDYGDRPSVRERQRFLNQLPQALKRAAHTTHISRCIPKSKEPLCLS